MHRISFLFFFAACCCALSADPDFKWQSENGIRWRPLSVPNETKPGFTRLSPEATGVTFSNRLDFRQRAENRTLDAGSGVAAGEPPAAHTARERFPAAYPCPASPPAPISTPSAGSLPGPAIRRTDG